MSYQEVVFALPEIKKAFWKTFHECGEIYFSCTSRTTPAEHEADTNYYWNEFKENLLK